MATALKLKNDINKLKAALRSKATPKSFLPKLKSQLEKAEADYESVKAGKKSAPKASKQVKSTMDKLKAIIKKKKYGAYRAQGVDLKKDADIPALPTGKRISKSGNTYYEYRANRIDVKQPPKRYPKLEDGGETSTKKFNTKYNVGKAKYVINYHDGKKTHKDGSPFYDLATFKNMKDFMTYKKKLKSEGYKEYKDGGYMAKGGVIDSLLVDQTNFLNELTDIKLSANLETEAGVADYRSKIAPIKEKLKAIDSQLEELGYEAYEKGGYMAGGGTIDNSGITPADLQNQIWNLTARIAKLGDIESQASYDEINMLMKQRKKLQSMALNHGDVVMAQGGELHRSQEEKFKYGGYMAGGNTDKTQEIFFFVKPRLVSELTEKANNEKVELEFIETNEDGNEVYRAQLTDSQINDFTKLPLQYDFNYDYAKGGYMAEGGNIFSEKDLKEILSNAVYHFYKGLNEVEAAMSYLDKKGQGGLKTALSKKFKLEDLKESIEKMDEYTSDEKEKGGYMADGGMSQGYDDREDERLSMEHVKIGNKDFVGSHSQKEHSRRDDAQFEERMAMGGALEHGLKKGDHIMVVRGNMLGIKNEITGEIVTLNIETGERKESKD